MEKRHSVRMKFGRYKKEKRTIKHCTINDETVWEKKWKTKLKTRLRLYKSSVKNILLYNCGTCELSRSDQKKLNN